MTQKEELAYILGELIPEFEERLEKWNSEYTQERDLGVRGEFVGLYRKSRKLKSLLWDGVDGSEWREDTRTILLEVVGHAFLALYDLDKEQKAEEEERPKLLPGLHGQTLRLAFEQVLPPPRSKKDMLADLQGVTEDDPE